MFAIDSVVQKNIMLAIIYSSLLFAIRGGRKALHIAQTIHTKSTIKGTREFGTTCLEL